MNPIEAQGIIGGILKKHGRCREKIHILVLNHKGIQIKHTTQSKVLKEIDLKHFDPYEHDIKIQNISQTMIRNGLATREWNAVGDRTVVAIAQFKELADKFFAEGRNKDLERFKWAF